MAWMSADIEVIDAKLSQIDAEWTTLMSQLRLRRFHTVTQKFQVEVFEVNFRQNFFL